MNKKLLSMIGLNLGIILADAFVLTNIEIGRDYESIFLQAVGVTVLLMSVVAFAYGNYKLLKKMGQSEDSVFRENVKQYGYVLDEIDTAKECVDALHMHQKSLFHAEVQTAIEQVSTMERKGESFKKILFQKCRSAERSEYAFSDVLNQTEQLLYENIKHMLSRIVIFDERDFEQLRRQNPSNEMVRTRMQIYNEHIAYIRQQIAKNEQILMQYDRLLMEISRMGDAEVEENEMMKHIKDVVDNMKNMNTHVDGELQELERKYSNKAQ